MNYAYANNKGTDQPAAYAQTGQRFCCSQMRGLISVSAVCCRDRTGDSPCWSLCKFACRFGPHPIGNLEETLCRNEAHISNFPYLSVETDETAVTCGRAGLVNYEKVFVCLFVCLSVHMSVCPS